MININNYILEKLHLSKDTKFEKLPKEGDDIICLAIDKGDGEIRIFKQHIEEISNENIVVTDEWGEYSVDINHEYKQYTCDYGDWIYVLYNLSLGLELINEIIDYHPKLKFKTNIYDMHEFDIKKWTDYPVIYDELYIQKEYYNDLNQLKSELEHGSITEKLHLNKDSKYCKKPYFEKGNKILPIQLDFDPSVNKTKIVLIEPTEIIELKDDTITYKDNSWFGMTIKQKMQKNDKGYYEIRMGTQEPCVILNQDDGQDLLNEYLNMIQKEKKPTIIEFFRTKYFDEKDKEYFYKRYQYLKDNITSIKKYISMI